MNTRLQELEKQSYELFKDENLIECFVFSKEKFAELIVRECARAVDRVYETAPPDYGCLDWSTIADGSDVLKHFGVEP